MGQRTRAVSVPRMASSIGSPTALVQSSGITKGRPHQAHSWRGPLQRRLKGGPDMGRIGPGSEPRGRPRRNANVSVRPHRGPQPQSVAVEHANPIRHLLRSRVSHQRNRGPVAQPETLTTEPSAARAESERYW
jgi:hypothetical protein